LRQHKDYTVNHFRMNEYRIYHCYQTPGSVACYPVDNEHSLPSQANSRLLFVSKYVPKILDTLVLNYKYLSRVHIKEGIAKPIKKC